MTFCRLVLQKTVFEAKESSHHHPKVLEKLPSQEVISPHKKGIPALASHAQIPSAGSQIQAHPVCNCEISGKMQRILRQEVSVLSKMLLETTCIPVPLLYVSY